MAHRALYGKNKFRLRYGRDLLGYGRDFQKAGHVAAGRNGTKYLVLGTK